jgi:hypothetical protein
MRSANFAVELGETGMAARDWTHLIGLRPADVTLLSGGDPEAEHCPETVT